MNADKATLEELNKVDRKLTNANQATLDKLDHVDKKLTNTDTATLGKLHIVDNKLTKVDKGIQRLYYFTRCVPFVVLFIVCFRTNLLISFFLL